MNISVEEVESAEMLSEKLRMRTETKKIQKNTKLHEELIEEVIQKKLREDDLLSETESLK